MSKCPTLHFWPVKLYRIGFEPARQSVRVTPGPILSPLARTIHSSFVTSTPSIATPPQFSSSDRSSRLKEGACVKKPSSQWASLGRRQACLLQEPRNDSAGSAGDFLGLSPCRPTCFHLFLSLPWVCICPSACFSFTPASYIYLILSCFAVCPWEAGLGVCSPRV